MQLYTQTLCGNLRMHDLMSMHTNSRLFWLHSNFVWRRACNKFKFTENIQQNCFNCTIYIRNICIFGSLDTQWLIQCTGPIDAKDKEKQQRIKKKHINCVHVHSYIVHSYIVHTMCLSSICNDGSKFRWDSVFVLISVMQI